MSRLLSSFKRTLAQWQKWDLMTRISNHQLVKDYLLDLFERDLHVRPNLHTMSSLTNNSQSLSRPQLHSKTILRQLLCLDATRLCAQLTVMVTDDIQYKQFVNLRGPTAQELLNLLQAVCDFLFTFNIGLTCSYHNSAWTWLSTRHANVVMSKR